MGELILVVSIAGRRAGIPAVAVSSVIDLDAITVVPRAPDFVAGLAAVRSQALTVIDCRRALGLPGVAERTSPCRAAVVRHDGHSYALAVDEIEDVAETLTDPQEVRGGVGRGWDRVARGMVETATGSVLMIDPGALIAGPESEAA